MILETEMIMVPNTELILRSLYIFRFTDKESSISINSVVPTFKETSDPIEEVFQMHTDDTIETDYSLIDTEPLDILFQTRVTY